MVYSIEIFVESLADKPTQSISTAPYHSAKPLKVRLHPFYLKTGGSGEEMAAVFWFFIDYSW